MRARVRPCLSVDVEDERVGRYPDERIGDHMRMLGEKERGQYGAGAGTLYVGGAHPVEERGAIVAGHADDDSPVEREDARGRTIRCLKTWHDRIKILQLGDVAYRGEEPDPNPFSPALEGKANRNVGI